MVIASYETKDLLLACLEKVALAQRTSPEFEIEVVVVDNGSRDGSARIAKEIHPAVRVIALVRNRGFAAAVNIGLRARNGRHALLLNSDVEVGPDLLAEGIRTLDQFPEIGVLGPSLLHPDGRPQRSVHALPGLATELLPDVLLRALRFSRTRRPVEEAKSPGGQIQIVRQEMEVVEAVRGAVFFIRDSVLEEVGLLDERYFFFLEETEYCARTREAGYEVVHASSLSAVHRLGASSKKRDALATRIEYHRSLYLYLEARAGKGVAEISRALRTLRGFLLILGLGVIYLFSPDARRRMAERWGLLLWHLQGCPAEPSMADALETRCICGNGI